MNKNLNQDLSVFLKAFDLRLKQATVNDHAHHKVGLRVIKACFRMATRDVGVHISCEVENALVHAIVENDW